MTTPRPSLITTDIDYDGLGFQAGHLRLPYSHDRSGYGAFMIPMAVLSGAPGPTLLLTGGNHGDEYEGPIALMKLMRRMPTMTIRGRLIVIPGLNYPALLGGTRTSPVDGGNLNRTFPGRREGSLTEMIAHYVEHVLLPLADVAFDLHAGGLSTNYLPTLLAAWPEDMLSSGRYDELIRAIDAPRTLVMDLLGEDRTFAAAAQRNGVLFLCGEFGGHGVCSLSGLRLAEEALNRTMIALGMVEGSAKLGAPALFEVAGEYHYVFADRDGLFEPAIELGDRVSEGDLAGWMHDPRRPLEAAQTLRFLEDGLVMCVRALAHSQSGDCLVHLARERTSSWD